ncbi:hypothetical protein RNJ44_00058 [Nakaseomyces bracarensis]|uniref:Uncharacterized protein n=1 Tax=Nakaseomyces bracarensis TaxID=273131 RepID=A0ABR4P0Z1_9SACH
METIEGNKNGTTVPLYAITYHDVYIQQAPIYFTYNVLSVQYCIMYSYSPTVLPNGHTGTVDFETTVTQAPYTQPPESTIYVTKDSTTETEVISFFASIGTDCYVRTESIIYVLSDNEPETKSSTETYSQPPETTAVVTKDSTTETDVISFFPTVGADGKTHTGSTTYTLVDTDTYSQPPETTAVVTKDSTTETDVISFFPTVGADGKTHTGSTTYTLVDTDTYSQPAESTAVPRRRM